MGAITRQLNRAGKLSASPPIRLGKGSLLPHVAADMQREIDRLRDVYGASAAEATALRAENAALRDRCEALEAAALSADPGSDQDLEPEKPRRGRPPLLNADGTRRHPGRKRKFRGSALVDGYGDHA